MLFFPNATIYVSTLQTTTNDEGTITKEYDFENPLESFSADVQPNHLTSAEIELYGLSSKTANTKKCFTNLEDGNFMTIGNRAKVVYGDSGIVEYYHIQPIHVWRFHKEFLLIPVENETEESDSENQEGNENE